MAPPRQGLFYNHEIYAGPAHRLRKIPFEVVPLLFIVGVGLTSGVLAMAHKWWTDPSLRRKVKHKVASKLPPAAGKGE